MKKNKWLIIATLLFSIIISIVVFYNTQNDKSNDVKNNNKSEKQKKVYEYTFPERTSKNDYFKWEFISNDIASIYPRRDALVRDILVDIGDEVKAGETLAILFNPWVGWEWQSKINVKDTVLSSKSNLLYEVINVKNAKIAELNQKIIEKEIILEETINNFDSKIAQIGDNDTMWSEYQVQLKSLENLQKNLENSIISKEELLKESSKNISQKEDLLNSKIEEIYNKIIPILYIWNESEIDYKEINSYDFSDYFWAKDSTSTRELVTVLQKYNNNFATLKLLEKYENLLIINDLLIIVLQNTISTVDISENEIQSNISNINIYNTSLISQKEILDDAKNMYRILETWQKEKIENIETKVFQKENELTLLGSKSNSTESEKRLAISKLEESIKTLKKSRDLLIANEDKTIVALENEIAIAKANLNNEYIKSWDYKIISPFSWIVSKRGIDVWEKISPNMEVFRLTWVNTTLSKVTKKEIKFYVPENLKDSLNIWKEIIFSIWDNNSSFTWTIYRISPEIDEKTFSITVQAKVDENITLPNKTTLRVSLKTLKSVFKIPSSSIYNKEERKIIYYKKDNWKLGVLDINIISDDGEYSLITWDFNETLKIVTTPIFIK